MSVWKSDETLLSICILNSSFKNDFVWEEISNIRHIRSSSKILRCASYFQLSTRCFNWCWNTASHVWYITWNIESNWIIYSPKTEKKNVNTQVVHDIRLLYEIDYNMIWQMNIICWKLLAIWLVGRIFSLVKIIVCPITSKKNRIVFPAFPCLLSLKKTAKWWRPLRPLKVSVEEFIEGQERKLSRILLCWRNFWR